MEIAEDIYVGNEMADVTDMDGMGDVACVDNVTDVSCVINVTDVACVTNVADVVEVAYVADVSDVTNTAGVVNMADVANLADVANIVEETEHTNDQKQGHDDAVAAGGGEKRWPGWPGESVFRILVPSNKVGTIIGRKGESVKRMCEESKARIKILDGPQGATERAVMVSAKEDPDASVSPAMDGLLKLHKRIFDGLDKDSGQAPADTVIVTRLLVPSTQAGNLIGKHGATIKSIEEACNCGVRILDIVEISRPLDRWSRWGRYCRDGNKNVFVTEMEAFRIGLYFDAIGASVVLEGRKFLRKIHGDATKVFSSEIATYTQCGDRGRGSIRTLRDENDDLDDIKYYTWTIFNDDLDVENNFGFTPPTLLPTNASAQEKNTINEFDNLF